MSEGERKVRGMMMERSHPNSSPEARRWSRVVDVVQEGVIYTEDAERLVLDGVRLPTASEARVQAEAHLTELVHDRVIFYEVRGQDRLGRLIAQVWVGETDVNAAMRARGYG